MKLRRFRKKSLTIMGILKDDIGGTYFTLERTSLAIPDGEYIVEVNMSPKFEKLMPLIYNEKVPASQGIRIHTGNSYAQTRGCILIGNSLNLIDDYLGNSLSAYDQLMNALKKSSGRTTLTITTE